MDPPVHVMLLWSDLSLLSGVAKAKEGCGREAGGS